MRGQSIIFQYVNVCRVAGVRGACGLRSAGCEGYSTGCEGVVCEGYSTGYEGAGCEGYSTGCDRAGCKEYEVSGA